MLHKEGTICVQKLWHSPESPLFVNTRILAYSMNKTETTQEMSLQVTGIPARDFLGSHLKYGQKKKWQIFEVDRYY